MGDSDLTIEVLKEIRSEMRDFRKEQAETNRRLGIIDERQEITNQRLDIAGQRLDVIESTLLTLDRRQRITLRVVRVNTGEIAKIAERVDDLETR